MREHGSILLYIHGMGGKEYGGGGRGRLYTYRYSVTTRMTPALRWAAMRAIFFLCFITGRDKVARQYRQFTTFEGKGEPKQIRTEVPLLTSLTALPLGPNGLRDSHQPETTEVVGILRLSKDTGIPV